MKALMQSRGGEYWLHGVGGSVLMNEQHDAGLPRTTEREGGRQDLIVQTSEKMRN